ncbi:MAG: hypothetical protein KKB50_14385 [Planctomycetes bacterium]|nr:hypothetical protein [Planctomycetota bacterium]
MNTRSTILLSLAVLALTAAGVLLTRHMTQGDSESEDFPEGTFWLCTNPECGAEFVKTVAELGAFYRDNPDAPLPCPKCGQTQTKRAIRCPLCKRFYDPGERGNRVRICPHCKQEMPRLTEVGGSDSP